MIIATAGHVDHGKTTLIHALTGEDTDRLAEEKRRGLTIDLGFAWTHTEQGNWLGFVDVPGHEKFIRNMVAGVSAVDAVMLVVAADDGPMPQTREHLAILDLLGVRRGIVALTRTDRVGAERCSEATEEVHQLLQESGLAGAPVFPVSGLTGQGVPALRQWLESTAGSGQPQDRASGYPRMIVDRSFSITGSGCVVTGTVIAGTLSRHDTLVACPAGHRVRLRGLEIHGTGVESVEAGQRCALNLAGDISRHSVGRGDWLVAAPLHHPTDRLDVVLTLLPSARLHRGNLQVHLGAAVRNCRAVVLDGTAREGSPPLAQLMLDQPVQACAGDRLILRDPASNRTLAGGRVLDPFGLRRGRSRQARVAVLEKLTELDSLNDQLTVLIEAQPEGVSLERLARVYNLQPESVTNLIADRGLMILPGSHGDVAVRSDHWESLKVALLERLEQWHVDHPDSLGPGEQDLPQLRGVHLDQALRHLLLQSLIDSRCIVRHGFCVHLPGHQPRLAADDQGLLDRVMAALEGTGLKPPIVGELAESLGQDREDMLAFLGRMHRRGVLVAVAPNRFYRPETVTELVAIAVDLAEESPTGAFDARAYRDRSGIGRRLTVSVLEYLDRAGVTAFINDERRLQPAYRRAAAAALRKPEETGYTA
ncbi:selenocysteine-specific translation elongation factor SelB [Marinobacter daqiaonensis]|uniref:Selenocysteine-specific translation elongation factor SelB n=1 Tax=Marinobacter daqiaonensis TaxID=650891 RepID=A0A1I6HR44_9GAMM|nr:selenocysteine-specific translation elongation factor [Marinobacter daqiaonensis]SFR56919.1 selenocysteine-specific translation elongation factor SelB [Marinobacter daqiaonensis]